MALTYIQDEMATLSGTAAKAWVNFNGTGTVAKRDDFNVTSITDNGTGNYTIHFSTIFADTNYCWVNGSGSIATTAIGAISPTTVAVDSFRFEMINYSGGISDRDYITIAVFGNQ